MKKTAMASICLCICMSITMIACTDARMGKITALGDNAKVECYSGGKLIYSGISTGKVNSELDSDGYLFVDKKTGKYMEVSGECVITYDPDVM